RVRLRLSGASGLEILYRSSRRFRKRATITKSHGDEWMNTRALLTGMEWFPLCAGGLHRYFYDEVHTLPQLGIGGTALVTYLDGPSEAPIRLQAMAPQGASLPRLLSGAHGAVNRIIQDGVDIINSHFALYAYPWVRNIPRSTPFVVNFHGPWAGEM